MRRLTAIRWRRAIASASVQGPSGSTLSARSSRNGLNLEAELTGVANEVETRNLGRAVAALLPVRSGRLRQEPDLLVVADCRHFHLCAAGEFADWNMHGAPLDPLVA